MALESAGAGSRPRLGLRPTRPQHAAGIRIEPPPPLAWPIGTTPAGTRAAEPPEEPPVEISGFRGFRAGSPQLDSVVDASPNSGSLDLAIGMALRRTARATALWRLRAPR